VLHIFANSSDVTYREHFTIDGMIDPDNDCIVVDGWCYSHYDDVWISSQEDLAIDYVVSLSEAESSGAPDGADDSVEHAETTMPATTSHTHLDRQRIMRRQ